MIFKHFETRAKAKAYIAQQDPFKKLSIRKKHGKHVKPYTVGTPLEHLHFTPDSWVRKNKKRRVL